jgi:hypothetical protein
VSAQLYRNTTFGFNTRETFNKVTGETIYDYYIIDSNIYSNVQISGLDELYELGVLYDELYFTYYAGDGVRFEFPQNSNSVWIVTLRSWVQANSILTSDIINGQEIIYGFSRVGLIEIIDENDMIILHYPDRTIKLYNIPEYEIEHKYLRLFVKNVIRIINEIYSYSIELNGFNSSFDLYDFRKYLLPNLRKQELAIVRNLLFARHNYAFQTAFWKNFMEMYYPENYVGVITELEVMRQFNWFEEWLLEQIINYENDSN